MEDLNRVQRWLMEAVTARTTASDLEQHLLASSQQTAAERLGIYQNAYTARLLEVLKNLFPCARFAVGDDLFAQFAAGYLRAHPPKSYTLARLADRFADYLEATRPADWGAFVVELVRLEDAIDRFFDAPGPEKLPQFSLPRSSTESIYLKLIPGFELHRFSYPVSDYYTAWKSGGEHSWPEASEQFVALLRRDYVVRRYALTAMQHAVLAAIQAGKGLHAAIAVAASQAGDDSDFLARQFSAWFEFWAAERFFA